MDGAVKQDSIFVRIDTEEKKQVESICKDMGITAATAAKMFFKQLIKDRALPFVPRAQELPWAMRPHTQEEIYNALLDSEQDIKNGNVYTEEQFQRMAKDK